MRSESPSHGQAANEGAEPTADSAAGSENAHEMPRTFHEAFPTGGGLGATVPDGLAQALLRNGPPLAVRDDKGRVHFANAAFHDLTEALITAKAWPAADELMAVIEARGQPIDEGVAIERDGRTRFFLTTHDILPAEAGGRSFVVSRYTPADGLGQRLPALESSDERSRNLSDSLAQQAALRRAAEVAEEADRAKSDFLAGISHELRTPLNAIIGLSDLMVSGKTGAIVCDRYREYLIDIRESGQHLLSVINQILTLAKSEAGRIELIEEDVDPIRLVRSALRVVTETARQRGVMLALSLPCAQLSLRADEGKLRQILLNLLSNALKFTPEDGTVECILRQDADGGVCFEVRDTGIGIDPDQVETAFAPFGQIALPTGGPLGRKAEGTGLGLPISRGLAEAHGGTLELDSTPGEGTTVRVRLPASRVHAT